MSELIVGIHRSSDYSFADFLERYEKILTYNEITVKRLYVGDSNFWHDVSGANYFISRFIQHHSDVQIGKTILPIIETVLRIECLPNLSTYWHYDDKIRQYYLLKESDFPVTNSFIFWDEKSAIEWLSGCSFPIVFKLKGGAGSANVVLVRSKNEAIKLARKMFSKRGVRSQHIPDKGNLGYWQNTLGLYSLRRHLAIIRGRIPPEHLNRYWQVNRGYAFFQEYLPNNPFDIRVTVIGNRAFAFRRFVRPNDFRASGSGLIDYDPSKIDHRCLSIALAVSHHFGFQTMAYDFLLNQQKEPRIVEISYTFVDNAIHSCPGYWSNDLKWFDGHYWPQYCQLQDLITEVDLLQPEDSFMLNNPKA